MTLAQLNRKFADRLERPAFRERDGEQGDGAWSFWATLRPGWKNNANPGCAIIHEETLERLAAELSDALPP